MPSILLLALNGMDHMALPGKDVGGKCTPFANGAPSGRPVKVPK